MNLDEQYFKKHSEQQKFDTEIAWERSYNINNKRIFKTNLFKYKELLLNV